MGAKVQYPFDPTNTKQVEQSLRRGDFIGDNDGSHTLALHPFDPLYGSGCSLSCLLHAQWADGTEEWMQLKSFDNEKDYQSEIRSIINRKRRGIDASISKLNGQINELEADKVRERSQFRDMKFEEWRTNHPRKEKLDEGYAYADKASTEEFEFSRQYQLDELIERRNSIKTGYYAFRHIMKILYADPLAKKVNAAPGSTSGSDSVHDIAEIRVFKTKQEIEELNKKIKPVKSRTYAPDGQEYVLPKWVLV